MKLDKVNQEYFNIIKAGYLEDRREYNVEEFSHSYPDFTSAECELLERLVQANFYVYQNSDDLLHVLAKELAGDIQMEIDDRDIGANTTTEEYLSNRGVLNDLTNAVNHYRNL